MRPHKAQQAKVDRAIHHSIRAELLRRVANSTRLSLSPREALAQVKADPSSGELRLGTVVYHAGVLEEAGLLKRGDFDPSRGWPLTLTRAGQLAVLQIGGSKQAGG